MAQSDCRLPEIIEAHYAEVYAFCRHRMPHEDDAHDLTQSTFLALIECWPRVKVERVRPWLFATAANLIADFYRRRYRESELVEQLEAGADAAASEGDPCREVIDAELAEACRAMLAALSERERELCADIARYEAGETDYAALAEKYAVSQATVRKRVSRLRRKVRKWLSTTCLVLLLALAALVTVACVKGITPADIWRWLAPEKPDEQITVRGDFTHYPSIAAVYADGKLDFAYPDSVSVGLAPREVLIVALPEGERIEVRLNDPNITFSVMQYSSYHIPRAPFDGSQTAGVYASKRYYLRQEIAPDGKLRYHLQFRMGDDEYSVRYSNPIITRWILSSTWHHIPETE